MSKTEYKEDWIKHNFACTEVKRECALPSEFDSAIFDAEQRQIIADYLSDYRTEVSLFVTVIFSDSKMPCIKGL